MWVGGGVQYITLHYITLNEYHILKIIFYIMLVFFVSDSEV
jgi:hypothetical protein